MMKKLITTLSNAQATNSQNNCQPTQQDKKKNHDDETKRNNKEEIKEGGAPHHTSPCPRPIVYFLIVIYFTCFLLPCLPPSFPLSLLLLRRRKRVVFRQHQDPFLVSNIPSDIPLINQVGQQAFNLVDVNVGGGVHPLVQLKDELDRETGLLALEHPAVVSKRTSGGETRT